MGFNSGKSEIPDSLSDGPQRSVGDVAAWTGQRVSVERSAGYLRPFDLDLMDDIQTISGDHKTVVPELDGGVLTGTSSDFAAEVGDEDGEVDGGLQMTAKLRGYSMVVGVAPRLAFVFPNSDEMRWRSKSTNKAPTTKIELGLGFGIEREREWGRRQSLGCSLPSSRSSMASGLDSEF